MDKTLVDVEEPGRGVMADFEQVLHSEALNQKAPHETRVNDFEDGARWANARIAALLRPVVEEMRGEFPGDDPAEVDDAIDRWANTLKAIAGEGRDG